MADRFGGAVEGGTDRFGGTIAPEPAEFETIGQFGTGVNEGLAEFLGMPVDIVNSALSMVGAGAEEPIGGSESLKNLLSQFGVMRPEMPGYEVSRRVGKEVGAALPAITGVGAAARAAPLAVTGVKGLGRTLIEPAIQKPARTAAGEVIAGIGAGFGGAAAEQVAPGSTGAEITGQIVGGMAPALTPTATVGRLVGAARQRMAPTAQRQVAREQLTGMLGEEITETVGKKIVAGQEVAGKVPGLKPSLAELAESPSLVRTQQAREARLTGAPLEQAVARHEGNVAAINDFAESVAPTGVVDVDVVIDRAGKKVESLLSDIEGARPTQAVPKGKPNLSNVGASMREELINRRRAASAEMSNMADDMGLNDVDITPQFDEIRENLIETMTPSGRFARTEYTPDVVKTLIDDRSVNVPTSLEDLKILREAMGDELRGTVGGAAPDYRKARSLKMGIKQLDDALETLEFPGDLGTQYKKFRTAYYDNVIVPFERGAAFKVKQKGTKGHYVTEDERVAHTFFGPKKETDMAQFVRVFGDDPEQMDAMRSVIMDDFRTAVVREGEIKPRLMERWLERFSGSLNQIPGVRNELADVASANMALNKRNASLDVRSRQIGDAILTKKLKGFQGGAKSGEQVVSDAIKNPRLMRQLTNRLRGDDEALESLRRHVWDDIVSNDARTMRTNIEANEKALTVVLGKSHMNNIDTIIKAREMIERVPVPTGAELTAGPLQAVEKQIGMGMPAVASRIYAIESGRIGARYMMTEMFSRFMRGQSAQEIERLLDTALYDPEIAKDLANAIKFPASKPAKNRMKKHLFNLGMVSEEPEPKEQRFIE